MTIYKIKFKRTKESEWESGIRIEKSTDGDIFIDKHGNILPTHEEGWIVYEAKDLQYNFCIDLTPIKRLKIMKKWIYTDIDNQQYGRKRTDLNQWAFEFKEKGVEKTIIDLEDYSTEKYNSIYLVMDIL